MDRIINYDALTNHGNIKGRKLIADIMECGLKAADPYHNTMKLVRREGDNLIFEGKVFEPKEDPKSGPAVYDLSRIDRVYLFAIGKGMQRIAKAVEDLLGDDLTGGHVVAKHGDDIIMERVGVTLAGHPVPDEYCVIGCQKIVDMIKEAKLTERDLVITIVGNGVSSLCTLPVPEVPLEDVMETTRLMQIEYGVPTDELNQIRNNIDQLKGGRIARMIQPAKMVNLLGVAPEGSAWKPATSLERLMRENLWLHSLSDATTAKNALDVIKKWDKKGKTPESVVRYLENFDEKNATVCYDEYKNFDFRVFGVMPAELSALPSAMKRAEELGFKSYLLANPLRAEAADAGGIVALIAKTCERLSQPFTPPCAFFSAGEILVTCGENPGVGGRNQEYCTAAISNLSGSKHIVMAAVDTDGTDGPGGQFHPDATAKGITVLAGGIVDGYSAEEVKARGLNIQEALATHATSKFLWELDSGIAATHNISIADLACTIVMSDEMLD